MNQQLGSRVHLALNGLKARLGVGDYWYYLAPEQIEAPISIRALVYPLRYDVLVRKSLYDLYVAHRELYRRDPGSFLDLAQKHDYYTWFTRVLLVRYAPDDALSAPRLRDLFAQRVASAVAVYDSIVADGFDPARPVEPYTGREILPADSGRVVQHKYYAGDGCHRLACLMSQGYNELPREFVRIKCFKRLVPFDNTALLARHLEIAWPEDWRSGEGR